MSFQFKECNNSAFNNRGFFGIAILNPKREPNVGVLWRSASIFGASFIATVGKVRYKHNGSDTMKSWKHLPLFHFESIDDLRLHLPKDCSLVGVEMTAKSSNLQSYVHPERALYLLGAEDWGIPFEVIQKLDYVIKISTQIDISLNVGVAGSIVCYDRCLKGKY